MPNDPGSGINRYSDLITEIPVGEFYTKNGTPVPYKGDEPYDLVLQTTQVNQQFTLYVNDKSQGIVHSDTQGVARFSVVLDLGRNDILLETTDTGQQFRAYLDAKLMHTVHAALAEVIENVDENIQDTFNDRRLEASERNQIEDVWGARLLTPNSPAYQHEAYREILQEIHQGYRMFGGRRAALDNNVGAFTSVTPLVFHLRDLGWILGATFLRNQDFQERSRTQFTRASDIPGVVSIDSVGAANQTGAGTLTYAWPAQTLSWTTPGGSAGPAVDVSAGGSFTLPGVALAARFDGRINGPFNIVLNTNDTLRLNIDGIGTIDITLTAGAARTAVQVAADINTALNADTRYGAPYATTASVLTTQRLRLTSVVTGASGSILIENHPYDAFPTVFGYPWVRDTLVGAEIIGSTSLDLVDSDDFPDADAATGTYKVLIARNTAREEVIEIIDNNRTTDVLTTVAAGLAIAKNLGDEVIMLGSYPHEARGSDNEEQGITVTVDDTSLPGAGDTETITLAGSNVPDFWLAGNATADLLEYGWFDWQQLALTNNGGGDTTLETDANPRWAEYKEWPFTFQMWVRNLNAASVNVHLGVNFGSGWIESGATAIPSVNVDGGDAMTFLSYATVPPKAATQFKVRIRHDSAGVGETLEVAQAKLVQPNVTAAFLGINTVPRSEHRGYMGLIAYIWSPVPLVSSEENLIGLNALSGTFGHVDFSVPAHSPVDRFDISDYILGAPVVPKNIRGVYTEADLYAGTITNAQLAVRTPARRSYVAPSRVSQVSGETLPFIYPPVAPYTAPLAVSSDQDQSEALLYENGVLVPNDRWQFNSSTEIEVIAGYDSGATYTIDYQALIQWESPIIDLLGTFTDFVWYCDYYAWTRYEPELLYVPRSVQLVFNPQTRRAVIPDRSDSDKSSTVLTENDGLKTRTINTSRYRYLDPQTILLDSEQFKPDALYFLDYIALRTNPHRVPTVTVEIDQSTDAVAWVGYSAITKDDVLASGYRYLRYRISFGNVVDLRDCRLYSCGAKGLELLGTGGMVPILRP